MGKWSRLIRILVPALVLAIGLAYGFGKLLTAPELNPITADPFDKQPDSSIYPLQTSESFTYWSRLGTNLLRMNYSSIGDTPYAMEAERQTGVRVNWQSPSGENDLGTFHWMLARGEFPDVIEYNWVTVYPGGPEKAIEDGVIIELNDLIDKHAPNLKRLLEEQPELRKMIVTDSGKIYAFPMVRSPSKLVYKGLMLRKDWLDQWGLEVPETIAEWEVVLETFKRNGVEAPLTFIKNSRGIETDSVFFSAYGASDTFYIDEGGQVRFGPAEPQFVEAVSLLADWYSRGLLDKDIAMNDVSAIDYKLLNGKSGAVYYLLVNGLRRFLDTMEVRDPAFDMVAAPYPVLNQGDVPMLGHLDFLYLPDFSAAITSKADNPELITKWMDYFYSHEGMMLNNYGIEGVTYEWVDGKVVYADWLDEDPLHTRLQLLTAYRKANGPTLIDDVYEPEEKYPQVREAEKIWANTNALRHKLPPFLIPTVEEASVMARALPAIVALSEEMKTKMIMGVENVDYHPQYIQQMRQLGLDQVLAIYQSALTRYEQR